MSVPKISELRQVMLPCRDVSVSLAFYRDALGATLIAEFPPGLAFFDLGGTRLLLEQHDEAVPAAGALYFAVDDIQASVSALRDRGIEFDSAPHLIFEDRDGTFGAAGQAEWMAFFHDPDGNTLALAERRAI